MKREITFTFRKSIVPSRSELDYYFFSLTARVYNDSAYITEGISMPEENFQFYLARNIGGIWNILGDKSDLPEWLLDNESSYGNAIDESLGIEEIHLDLRMH